MQQKISVAISIFLVVFLVGVVLFYNYERGKSPVEVLGYLAGKATVGPICPVERPGVPCPVPPEAYTSREIAVYKSGGKTLVASTHFDERGYYRFELKPGTYIVDIAHQGRGIERARDFPAQVTIRSGETVELNVDIDTGIR